MSPLDFESVNFLLGYLEEWAREDHLDSRERSALLAAVELIERGLK